MTVAALGKRELATSAAVKEIRLMRRGFWLFGVLGYLALSGCNGDIEVTPDDDGGSGGDSSGIPATGGNGAGPTTGGGGCGNFDYVFEPVAYGTTGDVIRDIVVVGDCIYDRTLEDGYRVPAAGGVPERLALNESAPKRLYEFGDNVAIFDKRVYFGSAAAGDELSRLTTAEAAFHNGIMTVEDSTLYSLHGPTLG
jgi:hypothetical protein